MIKRYDIKRGDEIIATVKPEGYVSEQIMGDSSVSMSFTLGSFVEFHIGDTLRVDQFEFILNTEPSVTKVSGIEFKYDLLFQGYKFELAKTAFLSLGDDNSLKEVDFALMGNAVVFVDLIVANLNREHSGWLRGTVDDTEFKNLTFSEQNCLSALADLASEFNTEYWISGKTIHLTKRGAISGLNLEYGRGKGLYGISRNQPSDKNVFTRIIARGGEKNIPGSYRSGSTRLQLPGSLNYLERNVDKYGVIEVSRTYEEIYPRREGTVSAIGDEFTFSDAALDFDLNDAAVLIPGVTAKVTFNTGQLAGYIFDIATYNHATRTFIINVNTDEKAINLPSSLLRPTVGDKYVITDIIMPVAYIEAAEVELQTKAQADLNQGSDPWAQYRVDPDPLHFKRENILLNLGDYVHLTDTDLVIDDDIRIIGYKKDLQDYFKYTEIDLATVVAIASIVKQYSTLEKGQRAIQFNRLTDAARTRRNYKTTQELKNLVFDADGYFTDKIRPLSIETTMLSVGAKSQQFVLNGSVFSPNFGASQAKVRVTAGTLDHFSIAETIRTWNLSAFSNDSLLTGTAYYIYAKCDKGSSAGAFLFTTQTITVDEDASYFHFLIGVLHSPVDGVRGVSLTYGQTTINGKFITTGVITSTDGLTYFNLDSGEIGGKIVFTAGSSGYDNLTDKPDLSALAETAYVDAIKADLQNQIDGQITSWFYSYVPTLSNVPAVDWSTNTVKDNHLGDLFYNTLTGYAYRFMKSSGVYSWSRITDTDVVTALANAAAAQDTADGKRRVFVTTPVVPYDVGDLWTQGTGGDLMRCATAKTAAQSYSSSDWVKAVKYTDDTATTALQAALGAVAYENLIETAKLGTTVIEGGYIKSTLLNVSAIVVAGGLETTSGAQSKANAAQSAAQGAAATDAQNRVNTLQAALGSLSYLSTVEAAQLGSTVIVGGYIKSSLLDVATIIVNGSLSTTADAQSRANGAQSAAQTYAAAQAAAAQAAAALDASSKANGAQSAATSAAASDATAKANAAQAAAEAYAASATGALSSSLGSLAYQSLVEASMMGTTVIVGGYIKTSLLDVDFIKGLNFNFVTGTVGGFTITSSGIYSDKHDGKLEIGSGDDPYIHMTRYFYPSPEVKLTLFGSRMTPYGIETMSLLVRSGGIVVDTDKPGVTGTFLSGDGVSTITVQDGVIIGL